MAKSLKQKREEAIARLTQRIGEGDAQQLAKLIRNGHSNSKEAKRLRLRLEKDEDE